MDQSLQNELQGLPGISAPIARPADRDHYKNVDVRRHKYNFVRRMRKHVLHQAGVDGSSIFIGEPADGRSVSPIGLEPANRGVSSTFAKTPAEGGSRSFVGVEPASAAGGSTFALEPPKKDRKSPAGAEQFNAESQSAFRLEPATGAANPALKLEPALGGASSLVQQPNQPHLQPLLGSSNSNQNTAIQQRSQIIGAISPAKDATADAKIPSTLKLTASHLDSVAAAVDIPTVLPSANQSEGEPNSTYLLGIKFQTSEKLTTNNTVRLSTSSVSPITPSVYISDDKLDDTKKLVAGKISSNSKTFQSNLELRPLAVVTKVSASEETSSQANNSTEELILDREHHEGLVPPQPWPAAAFINVPPNQPVVWNKFGAPNNSKLSQNMDANSTNLSGTTNTSSSESDSSESKVSLERESVSREENAKESLAIPKIKAINDANISSMEQQELKNILNRNPIALGESTSLTVAPPVKTQIGDVIEATYESDSKTFNAVHLHRDSGYTKNLTGTPHLPHILAPSNRENLEPTHVNLSCSVHRLLFSNAMHTLNITRSETPAANTSHPEQASSQKESLLDRNMIGTGQNRALSGSIVSYYPLIMVPWVLVSRYPIHATHQFRIPLPPTTDDEATYPPELIPTTKNDTTRTTPEPWTYQPNTSFSDILLVQKHESGKAHNGHFVQLMASPLFYVGESFTYLPSNKNTDKDSNKKNSTHQ